MATTPELQDRMRRVRALLDTRHDYVPFPRVLVAGASGAAGSRRVPCGVCNRSGYLLVEGGPYGLTKRLCIACDGAGWRRRRAGEEEYDEYLGLPVREAVTGTGVLGGFDLAQDIRRLDAQIARLQADADTRAGRVDHERYSWERRRQAYDRAGSYKELGRVLVLLGGVWPQGYYLLVRDGSLYRVTPRELELEDVAVCFVAKTMRGPISVPPWILEDQAKRRQATVEELAAQGLTAGQIGRKLRMPKEAVRRVLKARRASEAS